MSKSGEEKAAQIGQMWWKELFKFNSEGALLEYRYLKDCCLLVTLLCHPNNATWEEAHTVDIPYGDSLIGHQGFTFF